MPKRLQVVGAPLRGDALRWVLVLSLAMKGLWLQRRALPDKVTWGTTTKPNRE